MSLRTLKNGIGVSIREAAPKDAEKMIAFYNRVGGESDFLSFGEGEFLTPLSEYELFLASVKQEQNALIVVAEKEEKIISIASITSSQNPRNKHVGTLGIVVEKSYSGLGLGRQLMIELIEWARTHKQTKKIELVTREDNQRAISLYRKLGFQPEGLKEKDTYINGVYYNTMLMGLHL
ncbi:MULTISPECIES: GNAT family N-acetyltransferase [Priestia]|uniref:GNAT family N-acetyltransferase n=1 Tax=Priestia TaxID=2800373 RepID=UPI0005C75926|nr:GNAT family N-acetyltransferase [Priestia megaterium]MEB2264900.1 GNAT N-acetyltransferase [Priestia megaterium]NGY81556.1 GNAT family N-acetyltransferase [Priestia megaterium]